MPSSLLVGIMPIMMAIMEMKPKSILDIGVGTGKWGLLCREYLDDINIPIKRLDGIEIFKPYINKTVNSIYDNVYNVDVREFNPPITYDLYLIIDVIEHMTKQQGHILLGKLGGNKIVATPNGFVKQPAIGGNEHEKHICGWTLEDFRRYTPRVWANPAYVVAFIGQELKKACKEIK